VIETGHPDAHPGVKRYEGAVQGGCQGLAKIGPGEFTGMCKRIELFYDFEETGSVSGIFFYSSGSSGK
jgi:hypothetical protein